MASRKSKFEMKICALLLRRHLPFVYFSTARAVHAQALLTDQIRCHESLAGFLKKNLLNYLGKRKNGILYKNKHFKNCKIDMKSLATN